MRAFRFVVLAGISVSAAALACQVTMVEEVKAESPTSKYVLFVVDRSGSMTGDHFGHAMQMVRDSFAQPVDEAQFGLIAFNDASVRWPGKPEGRVPSGWAAMPSKDAADEALKWLSDLGAGGDTLAIQALRPALMEPRGDKDNYLTVALVSDGLFGRERDDDILAMIEECQRARARSGRGRAVIVVIGIGPPQKTLRRIAEAGKGGYIRLEPEPPEDEDIEGVLRRILPPQPPR